MVASGAGAPSLAYVGILSAPNGVTLPRNFLMARRKWLRTWLIVGTCFGVDHNAVGAAVSAAALEEEGVARAAESGALEAAVREPRSV